jgi:hypothetical protein
MALVHMDIKPDNIFISTLQEPLLLSNSNSNMEAILEDPAKDTERRFVYKIGEGGERA